MNARSVHKRLLRYHPRRSRPYTGVTMITVAIPLVASLPPLPQPPDGYTRVPWTDTLYSATAGDVDFNYHWYVMDSRSAAEVKARTGAWKHWDNFDTSDPYHHFGIAATWERQHLVSGDPEYMFKTRPVPDEESELLWSWYRDYDTWWSRFGLLTYPWVENPLATHPLAPWLRDFEKETWQRRREVVGDYVVFAFTCSNHPSWQRDAAKVVSRLLRACKRHGYPAKLSFGHPAWTGGIWEGRSTF